MSKGTNEPGDVRTSALVQALILQRRGHGKDREGPRLNNIRRGTRSKGSQSSGLGFFPQVRAAPLIGHLCE